MTISIGAPTRENGRTTEALKLYAKRFSRTPLADFLAFQGQDLSASGKCEIAQEEDSKSCKAFDSDLYAHEDVDVPDEFGTDGSLLCAHCQLPIGDFAYTRKDDDEVLVHGECKAQLLLRDLREEEEQRQRIQAAEKQARRKEHDIGWDASRIPRNVGLAAAFAGPMTRGMCCLKLQGDQLSVAPTIEPAASINLEYLAIALQIQRKEGRDALFSLDPMNPMSPYPDSCSGHDNNMMQVKRFEPEWLAGTSVGDLLFQADYYLKELSMGEHDQPVLGMKSCFEMLCMDAPSEEWQAREWFMVQKAEVHLSEAFDLIPFVEMGVEAREQIVGTNGLEDARITRGDHPLVKYAEAFSHNFDLIAERKSVLFHLRELAKASILAKLLADTNLLENWQMSADQFDKPCCLEIPQLWNHRSSSRIHVDMGKIVDDSKGIAKNTYGVYGGVDFGLSSFTLQSFTLGGADYQPRYTPNRRGARGVDLNLNVFDLTPIKMVTEDSQGNDASEVFIDAELGDAFWADVTSCSKTTFQSEDKNFLLDVFNPHLSDRRTEGGKFVPPSTTVSYLNKLRALLKEEKSVQQLRKDHFCSNKFLIDDAGPLFSSAWTSSFEIKQAAAHGVPPLLRRDFEKPAVAFNRILKSAVPAFERSTEDGSKFRIYRFGSLEVRTIHEHDGSEVIGAVFSAAPVTQSPVDCPCAEDNEQIVKVTQYVERTQAISSVATRKDLRQFSSHYYVVFEGESGNRIVTEKLPDGSFRWAENMDGLDDRNSLAKVCRFTECSGTGVTVENLRAQHQRETRSAKPQVDPKLYAQSSYGWALREVPSANTMVTCCHPGQANGGQWQLWTSSMGRKPNVSAQATTERNCFANLF